MINYQGSNRLMLAYFTKKEQRTFVVLIDFSIVRKIKTESCGDFYIS